MIVIHAKSVKTLWKDEFRDPKNKALNSINSGTSNMYFSPVPSLVCFARVHGNPSVPRFGTLDYLVSSLSFVFNGKRKECFLKMSFFLHQNNNRFGDFDFISKQLLFYFQYLLNFNIKSLNLRLNLRETPLCLII